MSVPGLSPIIILNNEQPSDRARFTLGHELAHIVMHRFPNSNMEKQADSFASAFLMPPDDMLTAFSGHIDLARLASLKPEWKVSMQALLYRATDLGLIEKTKASYLWKQLNRFRMKFQEPAELDFPMEQPKIVSRMIKLHFNTLGYSMPELAQALHTLPHRLAQYYELKDTDKSQVRPHMRLT